MARGDYVKTLAGAIAQGALNVIRGVFGAGASASRANEILQERFPSLNPQSIAALVTNTFRQSQINLLERQTRQVLRPAPPVVERIQGLPSTFRYLVEAVIATADGEVRPVFAHYIDSAVPLDDAELGQMLAEYMGKKNITEKYPDVLGEVELEDIVNVTYRVTREQIREGA